MNDLKDMGQEIVTQSALFEKFMQKLVRLELNDDRFVDAIFARACEQMPLYRRQIHNLKANLALLDADQGKRRPYRRAS